MTLSTIDIVIFLGFIASVIALGLYKSKGEGKDSESYFLAGRGLKWWLIGVSLIAANISSEQMVGMSGQAADYMGLAISSYEWMAAITLVVVAFFFLPYFLRSGIFTMPQFLDQRYGSTTRAIMAFMTMVLLVFVSLTGVIYAGGLAMSESFSGHDTLDLGLAGWCAVIGLLAAVYIAAGGLNASAWADLIQGIALILGGTVIAWFAITKLGDTPVAELTPGGPNPRDVTDAASGVEKLMALNHEKMHMKLPSSDKNIPWTALLLGLWIPNFYYWGLNQYITQRVLGSASLKEGQKGIVFAAGMKLIIPFVIVIPGIICFNLYSKDLAAAKETANQRLIERVTKDEKTTTVFTWTKEWAATHPDRVATVQAHNEKIKAAGVKDTKEEELTTGYKYDAALSVLMKNLLPEGSGWRGFVLAALFGAIVSSLAAVLNAASTIFTMDIYQRYINPAASQKMLVLSGRIAVGVFALIGIFLAPNLDRFGSIFKYIQQFQGYASPGILAVFVFGIMNRRGPGICGVVGLLLNPVLYWALDTYTELAFLDAMGVCFFSVLIVMFIIAKIKPLPQPVVFQTNTTMALESSRSAKVGGIIVVVLTLVLYAIFW